MTISLPLERRMRYCWLILILVALAACGPMSAQGNAPTQTRAAEVAQVTQAVATQVRVEELIYLTQIPVTLTAAVPTPTPTRPVPTPIPTRSSIVFPPSPTPPQPRTPTPTPLQPRPTSAQQSGPTATPTFPGGVVVPPRSAAGTASPTPPPLVLTATAVAGQRRTPTKPGLATFSDIALDEDRRRLYGADPLSGKVLVLSLDDLSTLATIDVGQAAKPSNLALRPDGGEIAVALNGSGTIALIDTDTLTLAARLSPTVDSGGNQPWDVQYAPDGRLFSTGNPGSGGFDYVHVFDTKTRAEIGKSRDIVRAAPRLAITADGTIFVGESIFSPQQVYRYAMQGNAPVQVARGPHGPVAVPDLAVRADGSTIYTAGGQVWSGNLNSQLGAFVAKGSRIDYVAATERLFICQDGSIAEVEATGNFNVVGQHAVSATPRVARSNGAGTVLYVSTDAGLDVIQLAAGR